MRALAGGDVAGATECLHRSFNPEVETQGEAYETMWGACGREDIAEEARREAPSADCSHEARREAGQMWGDRGPFPVVRAQRDKERQRSRSQGPLLFGTQPHTGCRWS